MKKAKILNNSAISYKYEFDVVIFSSKLEN